MKYLILMILSLLLFSCSERNKDDNSEIGFTSKECARTRGIYYEYMDKNCENCNIINNKTALECGIKYPENFRSADGNLQECLKEIFLPDLEVMKTWANTEIEEQTPLCRYAFAKNDRKACVSLNEFFVDELKTKCATDPDLANLVTQHTTFYTNDCNTTYTETERTQINMHGACIETMHTSDCTSLKAIIGTNLETLQADCSTLTPQ